MEFNPVGFGACCETRFRIVLAAGQRSWSAHPPYPSGGWWRAVPRYIYSLALVVCPVCKIECGATGICCKKSLVCTQWVLKGKGNVSEGACNSPLKTPRPSPYSKSRALHPRPRKWNGYACSSFGSLIKQHISSEHLQCIRPSVLYSGRNKQKGRCDPWLQAAHYAVGKATSTDPKQSTKLTLSWKLAVSSAVSLLPNEKNCDPLPGQAWRTGISSPPDPSLVMPKLENQGTARPPLQWGYC